MKCCFSRMIAIVLSCVAGVEGSPSASRENYDITPVSEKGNLALRELRRQAPIGCQFASSEENKVLFISQNDRYKMRSFSVSWCYAVQDFNHIRTFQVFNQGFVSARQVKRPYQELEEIPQAKTIIRAFENNALKYSSNVRSFAANEQKVFFLTVVLWQMTLWMIFFVLPWSSSGCDKHSNLFFSYKNLTYPTHRATIIKERTWTILLHVLLVVNCVGNVDAASSYPEGENRGRSMLYMIEDILEQQPGTCHLVLAGDSNTRFSLSDFMQRGLAKAMRSAVVLDITNSLTLSTIERSHLMQEVWGGEKASCRILVFDVTSVNYEDASGFLETSGLDRWPEVRVIMLGGKSGVEAFGRLSSLQNSLYAVYFLVPGDLFEDAVIEKSRDVIFSLSKEQRRITLFWRCLYCDNGDVQIIILSGSIQFLTGQLETLYEEQCENFHGHQLKVISMLRFPYIDFDRSEEQVIWGNKVLPKDSVDVRMLNALGTKLNFTYAVCEPIDRSWGREQGNGSWTGMVGPMQRSQADLSTVISPTPSRLKAIHHERLYKTDELTITSLKPSFQVDYLSIFKPFTGDLWILLFLSVMVWSLILWLMQSFWTKSVGGKGVSLGYALFYGWGVFLEDPPNYRPADFAGQVMIGLWLIMCMVLQLGYRSSLMAHLIVLEKSKPIETFSDLLELKGWSWGIEPWMLSGAVGAYFQRTKDPVMQQMYLKLERGNLEENLERVKQGRHSFIAWRNPISVAVASRYADESSNPFYVSRKGFALLADFGWGFRKGASFRNRFRQLMDRMMESGILTHWQKEVIDGRIRQRRKLSQSEGLAASGGDETTDGESTNKNVVLALPHLQVAFYMFLIGDGTALLVLLCEILLHWIRRPKTSEPKDS